MFPEHVLKPLQAFLRLLASRESRSLLLVGQLVKMLLDIARLDEKKPEDFKVIEKNLEDHIATLWTALQAFDEAGL